MGLKPRRLSGSKAYRISYCHVQPRDQLKASLPLAITSAATPSISELSLGRGRLESQRFELTPR